MKLCTLVRDLFWPMVSLQIPVYFALQARNVLPNYEASHIILVHGEPDDEESISPIPLPSPAYSAQWRSARDGELSVLSIPHTSQPIRRSIALESGWTTCVDHWCQLWRIIVEAAFTILTGSSALLQMPGTSGDPLTRFFVFLFVLRVVPALLSAGILLYYFSKKHFRSGNFAMVWYQDVERYHKSCLHMPWTILALPAIALSWGAIFMLVAVFLSVWGDGLYPSLSSVEEVSPLTITCLRVIISAVSVVDVVWVVWLVVKLKALDEAANPRASAA